MRSIVALTLSALLSLSASALNVKDFGAAGDGTSDDTEAFRKAVAEANAHSQAEKHPEAAYYGTQPEVFVPSGVYCISAPIELGNLASLRGENRAAIKQTSPEADVIHISQAYRNAIHGLTLIGGRHGIYFDTNNVDRSNVIIERCTFIRNAGFAIYAEEGSPSTFAKATECVFEQCEQALHNTCDQFVLEDSWITTSSDMKNKAVIVNKNQLLCDTILGVPLVNGVDQRWVDNYGSVVCRHFRFGGEFGGFTPVVNFAKRVDRLGGTMVVLDSCHTLCAMGTPRRKCAVYCKEVPNLLSVTNSVLYGIPAVIVDESLDLDTYFTGVRPGMLRFDIRDNTGEFAGTLPQQMLDAAAKRGTEMAYGDAQLSPEETDAALKGAIAAAGQWPPSPPPDTGRQPKTSPAEFVEISPSTHVWDLDDVMDGTTERNGEYLAIGTANDDVVILRRIDSRMDWPHVLIKDVQVDLDKFPFLTWQQKDPGSRALAYAVKVIDRDSGNQVSLVERHWPPFTDYQAHDLRATLGLKGGVHTVDIKFYALGFPQGQEKVEASLAKGEYQVLDFIRLEAE